MIRGVKAIQDAAEQLLREAVQTQHAPVDAGTVAMLRNLVQEASAAGYDECVGELRAEAEERHRAGYAT